MPLYDFECKTHGHFDVVVPMSQADKKQRCPECGKAGRRIFGTTAPHKVAFTPHFNSGADRFFNTAREMHTWCDQNNVGIKTNTGAITYG